MHNNYIILVYWAVLYATISYKLFLYKKVTGNNLDKLNDHFLKFFYLKFKKFKKRSMVRP